MLPPRSRHLIVRTGSLSLWRGANCEIARATFSSLCLHRIALVAVRCEFSGRPRNLNRHFVRIGSLSLWRGENCEIARATFSSRCADRSRCVAVRIFRSPAQPSRHFVRIGSLSSWRGANFRSPAKPSRHFARIGSLSLWRASFDLHACSCNLLGALGLSDRSCYGAVLMLMVKEILRRDLDKEVFYRELVQRSCRAMSCRDLVQRSCQETSSRDLVQLRPCMDICWDHAKSLLV